MGLFKKDKIILNVPKYRYTDYTYYYADNKISDRKIIRDSKDDKEFILKNVKYIKESLSTAKYSTGSPVYGLLEYLRESEILFSKEDYNEIREELESILPYKLNHILEIIECMAIFSGCIDRKSRY